MDQLDVGIVGGSIAGCSPAILLGRAGHRVRVFERSRGDLVGRGGGIGTPVSVLRSLIENDILDEDFPHLVGTSMPFIIRTDEHPRRGHVPWEMPMDLAAFHWSALWRELRARVDDDAYRQGIRVLSATEATPGTVTLVLDDGAEEDFDLVVFADGYQSLGRRTLFPEVDLRYRGYMLWRGLLPESELAESETLGSTVPRLSFTDARGNLVVYFVPGHDGSRMEGERLVNWASYILLPKEELDAFMVDRSGDTRIGTIPPGEMRQEEEDRLKAMMVADLPDYYGEIIDRTPRTYVQLIYTAQVPAYHSGRMCLIGDAGSVAQPFTGSGVFKGYNNITGLISALEAHENVDAALASWNAEQVAVANRILALGEQMEEAFIWNSLDLREADAEAVETWWRGAVTFPEEFTYEAEDAES